MSFYQSYMYNGTGCFDKALLIMNQRIERLESWANYWMLYYRHTVKFLTSIEIILSMKETFILSFDFELDNKRLMLRNSKPLFSFARRTYFLRGNKLSGSFVLGIKSLMIVECTS